MSVPLFVYSVFMLHDQILERGLECDKVSVVKCGSLFNETLKKVGSCLTYVTLCQRCTHLDILITADKCVNKQGVCGGCVNTWNLCSSH